MWEGRNSIWCNKRSTFSLHLLYSFWHSFLETDDKTPYVLCLVFAKEILSIKQIFNAAKLLLADWLLFSMCLTNPPRNFMQNLVNIQTYNHTSQKIIWLSSSSIDIEVMRTVFTFFFFHEKNSKHLKHKQKACK